MAIPLLTIADSWNVDILLPLKSSYKYQKYHQNTTLRHQGLEEHHRNINVVIWYKKRLAFWVCGFCQLEGRLLGYSGGEVYGPLRKLPCQLSFTKCLPNFGALGWVRVGFIMWSSFIWYRYLHLLQNWGSYDLLKDSRSTGHPATWLLQLMVRSSKCTTT